MLCQVDQLLLRALALVSCFSFCFLDVTDKTFIFNLFCSFCVVADHCSGTMPHHCATMCFWHPCAPHDTISSTRTRDSVSARLQDVRVSLRPPSQDQSDTQASKEGGWQDLNFTDWLLYRRHRSADLDVRIISPPQSGTVLYQNLTQLVCFSFIGYFSRCV